ncbi:MAG: hypothetical protein PVJ17_13470 [Lysobacterales bacterium]|jgi:hypothetical protein
MLRLTSITLLCLLAGTAFAGTFELTDPANEMYEEEHAPPKPPAEPPAESEPTQNMRCTVDLDTGECFCIEKASAKKVQMSQATCAAKVKEALTGVAD